MSVPLPEPTQDSPIRELLSSADIARIVDRIAHQILERSGEAAEAGDVVLLGIPTRGNVLADRLAARLTTFTGRGFRAGSLDITLYRDDLRRRAPRALAATVIPEGGIDERIVVLVDDVLFSGRTVRAALDALRDHGRPAEVQLAVLVDRGHRQLPLRADYVGKNIPTALGDDIAVRFVEVDGRDAVELRRAP
ncbi:MAG: bifunctional pyr operon transcriptional regulator/uracil phosphoribosyltransferase PyrR [Nakamurella sp.]